MLRAIIAESLPSKKLKKRLIIIRLAFFSVNLPRIKTNRRETTRRMYVPFLPPALPCLSSLVYSREGKTERYSEIALRDVFSCMQP